MDLVRFAETNSFERDAVKPHAWRYRDYVIRAFNQDKPFDQLIREHLAGDELDEVTADSIIATGYYRLGLWDDEPSDPEQLKFDVLDDIIKTTSQVFLGLTMDCARCHDHKIDPIPQRDYYRLLAFFHNISPMQTRGDNIERVIFRDPQEKAAFEHAQTMWRRQTADLRDQIGRWEDAFAGSVAPGSNLVPAFDLEQCEVPVLRRCVERATRLSLIWSRCERAASRSNSSRWPIGCAIISSPWWRKPNCECRRTEFTRFELDGDDGVRLSVNGHVIAERDGLHQVGVPVVGTATLTAGRVPIRLEYFQNGESVGSENRVARTGRGPPFAWSCRNMTGKDFVRGVWPWNMAARYFAADVVAAQRQRVERLQQSARGRTAAASGDSVSPSTAALAPATYVPTRGSPHAPAEEVQPGFPQILGGVTPHVAPFPRTTDRTSGRRRVLAEWMTADDHPLTARVIANRVWQYHFGRGIVRSVKQFRPGGRPADASRIARLVGVETHRKRLESEVAAST